MSIQPREWFLFGQVVVSEQLRQLGRSVRERATHCVHDERGQTPTEYLMIVGLMAMVIIVVFVQFFWDGIREAANSWVDGASGAIQGDGIE